MLAWGISLNAARRHYPDTALITDSPGRKFLIDELGLQFGHVSSELDRLEQADPQWWALGKLIAYSLQDKPFIHIDTDVFLWRPLPAELAEAPVVTQCPEDVARFHRASRAIEASFDDAGAELPVEWQWAVSRDDAYLREENCGICGGNRVDFIRYYSTLASNLILSPEYSTIWARSYAKSNMVLEQFLLSACIDFHRFHPASPHRGVNVRHLFSSMDDAMNPDSSARAGFTHLLAEWKCIPAVVRRMEDRMRRDDPAFLRRCEQMAGRASASWF
jgi:hypothetical protein